MVTRLIQQVLGYWEPIEYKLYCRVLVAGEDVLLTVEQARRYEELARAKGPR
jgi:hypothetical protein